MPADWRGQPPCTAITADRAGIVPRSSPTVAQIDLNPINLSAKRGTNICNGYPIRANLTPRASFGRDFMRAPGASASASVLRTDDPDHFSSVLQNGRLDDMQRSYHQFRATFRTLGLNGVTVQHVEIGGCVNHGAVEQEIIGLALPVRLDAAQTTLNGRVLGTRDAVLLPGGTEFLISARNDRAWVSTALPQAFVAGLAELEPPPAVTATVPPPGGAAQLRATVLAAASMA